VDILGLGRNALLKQFNLINPGPEFPTCIPFLHLEIGYWLLLSNGNTGNTTYGVDVNIFPGDLIQHPAFNSNGVWTGTGIQTRLSLGWSYDIPGLRNGNGLTRRLTEGFNLSATTMCGGQSVLGECRQQPPSGSLLRTMKFGLSYRG
jgi:hypothetical protein